MAIDIHVQEEQVTVALAETTKVEYVEVEVEVKVDPVLQSKTATENGVVVPDSGFDGLSKVTVQVTYEDGNEVFY